MVCAGGSAGSASPAAEANTVDTKGQFPEERSVDLELRFPGSTLPHSKGGLQK